MTSDDKITGGSFSDVPNDNYRKFFDKFSEINTLKPSEFKPVHLIAYFCKKYKQHYGKDYKFSYKNPAPSKSYEMFRIKSLGQLLTADPVLLKNYIDWIFENKIIQAKRRITSISFLTREEYMNEYKFNVLLAQNYDNNISRTTPLPIEYSQIFKDIGYDINTYGDLSFIYQANIPTLKDAFDKLEVDGFDTEILSKIV